MRSHRRLRAPPPETRATDASHAERPEQVERVAQPERHALEHRADERAAVVPELQPDERAARVRVGVRRPLAGEVREEHEPLGARLPRLRLGDQRVERRLGRESSRGTTAASPAAESITPIACHVPGTAWQKAWTRASASWA